MHKNIFGFYNFDKEFRLNDLKSIPLLSIKKHFSEFDNKVYINNNELHFDLVSQNIIYNKLNMFLQMNLQVLFILLEILFIIVSLLKIFQVKKLIKLLMNFFFQKV